MTSLWAGEEKNCPPVIEIFMPSGQIVTVTEGVGEPRSIGSYSIRLYSGKMKEYPFDDFLTGTVRPRDGIVENVLVSDLDQAGDPELVVIMRSVGSGSYRSADAFSVFGNTIHLVETVSGLAPEMDPVVQLAKKIKRSSEKSAANPVGGSVLR